MSQTIDHRVAIIAGIIIAIGQMALVILALGMGV